MAAARPDIDDRTTQLVSKGRWMVPGYKVCWVALLVDEGGTNAFVGEIWGSVCALGGSCTVQSYSFCDAGRIHRHIKFLHLEMLIQFSASVLCFC